MAMLPSPAKLDASRTAAACGLMIAATVAIFLAVDRLGAGLVAPSPLAPVFLNVGLDQGVISPTLFSMMVVMAVVTTLAAAPVLDALARPPASASCS